MDNRFLVILLMFFSSSSYAVNKDHQYFDDQNAAYDACFNDFGASCPNDPNQKYFTRTSGTYPNPDYTVHYYHYDSCTAGQTQRLYGTYLNSSAVSASDCGVPASVATSDNCEWSPDVQGNWQVALNGSMCEWWSDSTSTGNQLTYGDGFTASPAGDGPTEPSTGGEGGDSGIGGGDDGSDDGTGDNDGAGDSGDGDGSDSGGDTGTSDGSDSGNGDTSGGSSGGGSSGGGSSGGGSGADGGSGSDDGSGSGDSGDGSGGGDTGDSGDSGDSDGGDNTGGDGAGGSGDDTGDSGDGDSDDGSNGGTGDSDGGGGSGECNPETEDCSDEPSGDCDPSSEECCDSETEECGDGGELDYRNCAADFVCDGDALQCAQLEVEHASLCLMSDSEYQDFLNSSDIKGDGTEISETGVLNALDGGTVDISDALNLSDIFNVSSSASCPEFPTVDTSYGSYSVDTTDNFCQYANTVRPFVIYMVSFFASLLVLRGITS
ncbi:MAG: hypothetical protein ACW7DQ_09935 [Paraglaciecola chathamensis]